jgi:hypothetical protein
MFEPLFEKSIGQKDICLCKFCNSIFDNKLLYENHLITCNIYCLKNSNKFEHTFFCKNCKKIYNSRSGLWYHKKKCTSEKLTEYQMLFEQNKLLKEENLKFLINEVKINEEFQNMYDCIELLQYVSELT